MINLYLHILLSACIIKMLLSQAKEAVWENR
jgi:hypothetical protein